HLAYMIRLGLWGQGTPFADFAEFAREIEEGGVGAMQCEKNQNHVATVTTVN
ncbi:MAG: strawberry notch family protein, partial [Acidobacteria bacterium]|nr:strawberry notch family protein [Acidobacteriota bacterium]